VLGRSGELETLMESTGTPLGLFQEYKAKTSPIPLNADSVIVFLTDGASEAISPGGEQLGLERVIEYAVSRPARTIATIGGALAVQFAQTKLGSPDRSLVRRTG
jgi:serine phosphatase RsbU (regulator of sigma subunit)